MKYLTQKSRFLLAVSIAVVTLSSSFTTPTVTSATAKQRFPWNGKVDVTYTVIGDVVAGLPGGDDDGRSWSPPITIRNGKVDSTPLR